MSERKINLDDYVDDLPLAVASYRNKLKIVMKELIKETLELAAENAEVDIIDHEEVDKSKLPGTDNFATLPIYGVDEQSILNTINQIE